MSRKPISPEKNVHASVQYNRRAWSDALQRRESEFQMAVLREEEDAKENRVLEWAKQLEGKKAEMQQKDAMRRESQMAKQHQEPISPRAVVPIRKDILKRREAARAKKQDEKN